MTELVQDLDGPSIPHETCVYFLVSSHEADDDLRDLDIQELIARLATPRTLLRAELVHRCST